MKATIRNKIKNRESKKIKPFFDTSKESAARKNLRKYKKYSAATIEEMKEIIALGKKIRAKYCYIE